LGRRKKTNITQSIVLDTSVPSNITDEVAGFDLGQPVCHWGEGGHRQIDTLYSTEAGFNSVL
jgi:hypothetical protein